MSEDRRRSPDWDVRRGPANYAALVTSYILATLCSLVAISLVTRGMPRTAYGEVIAILAVAQLAQQIGISWTALSVGAFGGAAYVDRGNLADVFWTRLMIVLGSLLLLALTAPWWVPLCTSVLRLDRAYVWPVLAYLSAWALWAHVQQALLAAKRIGLHAAMALLERVVMLGVVAVAWFAGTMTTTVIVGAYVLGAIAPALWAGIALRRVLTPVSMFGDGLLSRILRFSLPLFPGAAANFVASGYLSTFFLAHFLGAAAVALFGVAYQIFGAIVQLPALAGLVLQPYLVTLQSRDDARSTGPIFSHFVEAFTVAMGVLCLAVAGAGAVLVPAVFGESYRAASDLLWPLMASAALAAPAHVAWLPLATAAKKSYILAVNSGSTAVVSLALHALLTPRMGASGAAWAILAASLVTACVTVALLRRESLPAQGVAVLVAMPPTIAALAALLGAGTLTRVLAGAGSFAIVLVLAQRRLREGFSVARDLALTGQSRAGNGGRG